MWKHVGPIIYRYFGSDVNILDADVGKFDKVAMFRLKQIIYREHSKVMTHIMSSILVK